MIFVNFKTFEQGTGLGALDLVKIIEKVSHQSQHKIIPVVQAADIREIVSQTQLEVWVQKIDPIEFGAHTGSVLAEAVWEDGATGTFLNHSEAKPASFEALAQAQKRASNIGLKTLIFAQNIDELKRVLVLKPTYVAYEPPELIGSKTVSVSQAKPGVISEAANLTRSEGIPLIVGAGVHSASDVRKSIELGAVGVAVATDIVCAKNPEKELLDLVAGFE